MKLYLDATLGNNLSYTWRSLWSTKSSHTFGHKWKVVHKTKVNVRGMYWIHKHPSLKLCTPLPPYFDDLTIKYTRRIHIWTLGIMISCNPSLINLILFCFVWIPLLCKVSLTWVSYGIWWFRLGFKYFFGVYPTNAFRLVPNSSPTNSMWWCLYVLWETCGNM